MASDFRFSLEDLLAEDDDAITREMHRYQKNPMKTTRSINGDGGRLSVLSMGEIMMGKPLYNDQEEVLSIQELAMTHLLAGGIADINANEEGTLNIDGFQGSLLVPKDILYYANKFRDTHRKKKTSASAGGGRGGGGEAYDGVPADVAASAAFAATDPTGPVVSKWVNLLLAQEGDSYNNTGQVVRGITDDPNPSSFDCSGLLWWATNQLIPGTDFGTWTGPQWQYCVNRGTVLDNIDMAKRTRGAIIWPINGERAGNEGHTGVSLGDGTVMESSSGGTRRNDWGYQGGQYAWAKGALHPQMSYSKITAPGGTANLSIVGQTVTGAGVETFSGQNGPVEARIRWAIIFLKALLGSATSNNIVSMVAWQHGENTNAQYNPLATTEPWPGSTDFNNNNGYPVRNFAIPDDGFNATIKTITNGRYGGVMAGLQSDSLPEVTLGHFNGGPSGGSDLNTWGTGSLAYQNIDRARRDIDTHFLILVDMLDL